MNNSFILPCSVTIVVTLVLAFLNNSSSKQPPVNKAGQYVLVMPRLYKYVGLGSLVIADVFAIALLFIDNPDLVMLIITITMILLFGGLGILSVNYYKNHYLIFDDNVIQTRTARGVVKIVPMENLQGVSFNAISGFLILTTNSGEKIKIHQHLVGFSVFANYIKSKTEPF